ncbi:acyltransferase family protein [Pantoea sp. B65]|uniref:acyltransferase family protein n=1 Tax=Pantoea sp. B65 TaxID=2813359 RepID=UPI0039B59457
MKLTQRNVSLDFFRGIMSLLVCIGHMYYWNHNIAMPLSFILAVDFFLVLSGFVIAASVLNNDNFDAINFAKKRYQRLFPVYITCIILSVPLFIIWKELPHPNAFDLFKIITISQMIPSNSRSDFPLIEPMGVANTISAELLIGILIFPLVYFLEKKAKAITAPFLLVLILFSFLKINLDSPDFMNINYRLAYSFIPYGVLRCLMDYAIGILCYQLLIRSGSTESYLKESLIQLLCISAFFFLFCKMQYNRNNEILSPLLFGVFIYSLSKASGAVFKLTNNKLGVFLGDISYPIYLIHPVLIFIFSKIMNFSTTPIVMICYLTACILSAFIINRIIEKPSMDYFSRSR